MGICGAARFIQAYSCGSGRSSQRKTGSGFEASSARARNDSLLVSGTADPSPLWGNGPGQRDRGEPGVRSPLALRCRGLEGRSAEPAIRALGAAWRWRLKRSAPRSLALLITPRPTRRTLKRPYGALFSDASRCPHGGRLNDPTVRSSATPAVPHTADV